MILIVAFEDNLIYFPEKYTPGVWQSAELSGRTTAGVSEGAIVPRIEDCWFQTSDGVKLHAWYCEPVRKSGNAMQPVEAKKVLLWFQGNAGNISYRFDMIRMLAHIPVDIFIIDYRGYGRSEATPTEQGLYLDAKAAWDYLVNQRKEPPQRIIIFGKSLGGAVAGDLAAQLEAAQVEPAGLIVQSSFTSAADVASELLPLLPRVFLHTKMDSINKIKGVRCRKLFIHSRADEVIPFKLGYKLFEAASEPKEFYEVMGAPHNSTYIVGGQKYLEALRRFVEFR